MGGLAGAAGVLSSIGNIGDQAASGSIRADQYKMDRKSQELQQLMQQLQMQQLQQGIQQGNLPQSLGRIQLPNGSYKEIIRKPDGSITTVDIAAGADSSAIKQRLTSAMGTLPKEYQPAMQMLISSLDDPSTDPMEVNKRAEELMGQSAGREMTVGNRALIKGPLQIDRSSVTGYSQAMINPATGQVVETIPNVIVPGLTGHTYQGYVQTTDEAGNTYLVPETKTVSPNIPGKSGGAPKVGGQPTAAGQTPPAPGTMPAGAVPIGHKPARAGATTKPQTPQDAIRIIGSYRAKAIQMAAQTPGAGIAQIEQLMDQMMQQDGLDAAAIRKLAGAFGHPNQSASSTTSQPQQPKTLVEGQDF